MAFDIRKFLNVLAEDDAHPLDPEPPLEVPDPETVTVSEPEPQAAPDDADVEPDLETQVLEPDTSHVPDGRPDVPTTPDLPLDAPSDPASDQRPVDPPDTFGLEERPVSSLEPPADAPLSVRPPAGLFESNRAVEPPAAPDDDEIDLDGFDLESHRRESDEFFAPFLNLYEAIEDAGLELPDFEAPEDEARDVPTVDAGTEDARQADSVTAPVDAEKPVDEAAGLIQERRSVAESPTLPDTRLPVAGLEQRDGAARPTSDAPPFHQDPLDLIEPSFPDMERRLSDLPPDDRDLFPDYDMADPPKQDFTALPVEPYRPPEPRSQADRLQPGDLPPIEQRPSQADLVQGITDALDPALTQLRDSLVNHVDGLIRQHALDLDRGNIL